MKKFFILILSILLTTLITIHSQAKDFAKQDIGANLGKCITINNTVVNGADIPCGGTATLEIESVIPLSPVSNLVSLTPIQVAVGTNNTDSFEVTADFASLDNATFSFPGTRLSVNPGSITDSIVTPPEEIVGDFVPEITVNLGDPAGTYNGLLIFTVANL